MITPFLCQEVLQGNGSVEPPARPTKRGVLQVFTAQLERENSDLLYLDLKFLLVPLASIPPLSP
jgi:hypothetical protein